jgi:hypothetical protein
MGIAPSYLMIELSFWLAERSARAGKNGPADTGYINPGQSGSGGVEQSENWEPEPNVLERRSGKSTAAYRVCQV